MIFYNDTCPLCESQHIRFYYEDSRRQYWSCSRCCLVFVPSVYHLSQASEKREYDKHQNGPDDAGYREFLARLLTPMVQRLTPASVGMDYGCGPGPATAAIFAQNGIHIDLYDPIYASSFDAGDYHYDFVVCTEVVEHFRQPHQDWGQLRNCVKPGGLVGVMTKLVIDKERFRHWHYKNDPTHIAFYSHNTLEWIAAHWRAELTFVAKDAFIFLLP